MTDYPPNFWNKGYIRLMYNWRARFRVIFHPRQGHVTIDRADIRGVINRKRCGTFKLADICQSNRQREVTRGVALMNRSFRVSSFRRPRRTDRYKSAARILEYVPARELLNIWRIDIVHDDSVRLNLVALDMQI